jgi:hypothetical protein
VKTAKLEAAKKKRIRKANPIATSQDIKVEDEATDEPLVIDDRAAPRSPSPATMRQWELERQVTEEDLHRIKEVQLVASGVQAKMPTMVRARHLRLKLHATVVIR